MTPISFAVFMRAMPAAGSGAPARCPRRDRQRADGRRDRRRDAVQDQAADVFAHRAATVAFGVNPPEQRPSLSAATSHGRPKAHLPEPDLWLA